jgi:hypothetical protein
MLGDHLELPGEPPYRLADVKHSKKVTTKVRPDVETECKPVFNGFS